MKPMGPIPPFFEAKPDGQLCIGGKAAGDWLGDDDRPAFIYALPVIEQKIAEFRDAMPKRVALHYAVKANPYRPLLE